MKKLIYLFITTILVSCGNQNRAIPENFDFGITENGVYKNKYFDMEVRFNPNWNVQSKEQMNNLIEQGSEFVAGDNEDIQSIIKASKVNTAYLLSVFKHKADALVSDNPSFMIVAENTKNFPDIKTGEDYLYNAKKLLKQTDLPYTFEKEISERTIGNSVFHIMESRLNYMGVSVTQEYLATVSKGFSLTFILSYTTEKSKNELYKIIDQIKM